MSQFLESISVPFGLPVPQEKIESNFLTKSVMKKLITTAGFKEVLSDIHRYSNDHSLGAITSAQAKSKIKKDPFSMASFMVYNRTRNMVLSGAKPSWSSAISLEWQAIDDYCQCKFNKPYFSLDKPCLAKTEDLSKLFYDTYRDRRIVQHPSLFLGSMISAIGNVGGDFTIIDGVLDKVGLLTPTIMIDIAEGKNVKKAARAIWAISSLFDEGILLYTVLKAVPSVSSYLNFLRWDESETDAEFSDVFEREDSDYLEEDNPLNHHPDFSICIALAFARDFMFSRLSKLHHDIDDIIHKQDYSVAVQMRINQDFVNDILFELFKERASFAIGEFKESAESLFDDFNSLSEALSISKSACIKSTVDEILKESAGMTFDEIFRALSDMSCQLEDDVQYVTLLRSLDFSSSIKNEDIMNFNPEVLTNDVNEISSKIKSLSQDPVKNAVEISDAAIALKDYEEKVLSILNNISKELSQHITGVFSFLEKHVTTSENNDKPFLSQVEKLEGDLLSCFAESDQYKAMLDESQQEVKSLRHQIHSLQSEREGNDTDVSACKAWDFAESMLKGEATLPETCLRYFDDRYEDVVVLPSAYESAAQIPEFKRVGRMFELIDALVNIYLPSIVSGLPDNQAKDCFTHSAYKANESDTVKGRADLMNYRTFNYKGESVVMEQHLGTGVSHNKNETLRIYFKIIDDKVIIGHAGKHLPNS